MEKEKKENKKKIVLLVISIVLVLLIITGVSYAFWSITKEQEGSNKLISGCFNIELTNEKNNINLENTFPITDEEGMSLTPYTFTVTNTCSVFASYKVNLEMLEGTTLASKYIRVMVNKEEIENLGELEEADTVIAKSKEARKLVSGSLGSGDSEEYSIRLWMDEDVTLEDVDAINKTLISKVVVVGEPSNYNPVDNGITLLKDAILANEYQTTSVELAKNKIASKQSVDFSKTAPIIDWEEAHATSTTTVTATLPDPSLVNSGIVGTENLTATNVLPAIGTGYTFNSETGKYSLTNVQYVDPTTLDYSNNDYYYVNSYTSDNGNSLILSHTISNVVTIYKITGATKSTTNSTTIKNSIKFNAVAYKMTGYRYTQSEIESDKSDKGLYEISDADGTSYYYRGTVKNNYVYFANAYWRIIRINGDGSIRMLYAGTKPNAQGDELFTTLTDSSLGFNNTKTTPFNLNKDNPAYVGYMYGNTLNTSYELTNANENDSNMKKYLDSWYRQNIEEKGLSNYIADSGFCNDRSLATNSAGDGVTTDKTTYYAGRERSTNIKNSSLVCANSNDLFTVTNTKGNRALTYPIGLMTIDETMLSGYTYGYINRLTYTYVGKNYWLFSPGNFIVPNNAPGASVLASDGVIEYAWGVWGSYGVRPVINLSSNTEISGGIGTSNEPFIIK